MSKPMIAGWMCLGLALLGGVVSGGQDSDEAVREKIEAVEAETGAAVVAKDLNRVEVKLVEDGGAGDRGRSELVEIELGTDGVVQVEDKDVVISGDDGRKVETRRIELAPRARLVLRGTADEGQKLDPQTRESLEKLIGSLKDEAKRLEGEGKKDEVARKLQSIEALQQFLAGKSVHAVSGRVAHFVHSASGPEAEELKKLHTRRDELAKLLATKADANDEGAAKIKQELANVEKEIAEHAKRFPARAMFGGGFGGMPGMPGMAPMGMTGSGGMMSGAGTGSFGAIHARSEALARQADALSQAAAQLKQAGLGDQAKQLAEQAEKLRDQAHKLAKEEAERIHTHLHTGMGGGGIVAFGGAPPMELQRSIKELHEQVVQLRKEVAEIRELLQQKR